MKRRGAWSLAALFLLGLGAVVPDPVRGGNLKKETRMLQELAGEGDLDAQYELGRRYHIGYGVKQDYAKALDLYGKAAERGDRMARNNLASMYEAGEGVPRDLKKAVELYRLSAGQGFAVAQYNLGLCYDSGVGVKTDKEEAFKWYALSAENGDPDGMRNVGICYLEGKGVPPDLTKAWMWSDLARYYAEHHTRSKWAARAVLDPLEARMKPGQIETAQLAARSWSESRHDVSELHESGARAEASGDFERAKSRYAEALRKARTGHLHPVWISRITYNLGRVTGYTGDLDEAQMLLEEALAMEEKITGPESQITSMRLFELARLNQDRGRHDEAVRYFARGIPVARDLGIEVGAPLDFARELDGYAACLEKTGDAEKAAKIREEARTLRDKHPGEKPPEPFPGYGQVPHE